MVTQTQPDIAVMWAADPNTVRLYHALPHHYRGKGECGANTRQRDGRTRMAQPSIPLPRWRCRGCVARLEGTA